jgi:hypothetical protein
MNVKDKRLALIVALGVSVIALLIAVFYLGYTETFQIQDKCGRFINLFSHTIGSEAQCKIRCEQQCGAKELSYFSSDFREIENSCNDCYCTCTDAW